MFRVYYLVNSMDQVKTALKNISIEQLEAIPADIFNSFQNNQLKALSPEMFAGISTDQFNSIADQYIKKNHP